MAIYTVPRASHNNRVARLRVSYCVLEQLVGRSIPAWSFFFATVTPQQEGALVFRRLTF